MNALEIIGILGIMIIVSIILYNVIGSLFCDWIDESDEFIDK